MRLVRSRSVVSLVLVWVVMLVASCGGGSGGSSTLPSGGSVTTAVGTATTDALEATETSMATGAESSISVTTADDLAVSGLIGVEGGTLTATSGAMSYTLVVPPGAVFSPVEVSMTPIASVAGSLFEEPVAGGVVLAPEGLLFWEPALLTITGGPAAEGAVGFGFDGSGEGFHLVPFVPGDGVVVPVRHFSGYAYGVASPVIVARMAAIHITRDVVGLFHDLAAYTATYHATYGDAGDPDERLRMEEFAGRAEQLAIEALLAAESDPVVLGTAAVTEVLGMYRELVLHGTDPGELPMAAIESLLDKLDAALDKLCAEGTADPEAVVAAIMASERMRQTIGLIGADAGKTNEQISARIQARLDNCEFTLFATATVVWHGVNAIHYGVGPPDVHDLVLSGPLTPLIIERTLTKVPGYCPGCRDYFSYRWKAEVPLTISDFSTSEFCWNGAPPYTAPGFEPTLRVEVSPDLTVTRPFAPTNGAGKPPPAIAAAVTLDLLGAVTYHSRPENLHTQDFVCPTNTEVGVDLAPSWTAVRGASPERVLFGGGAVSWTRQSPPGTTLGLNGYYRITTEVTLSIIR